MNLDQHQLTNKKLSSTRDVILFIFFDRFIYRLLVMVLAFLATLCGIAVPYFQKQFNDSLTIEPLLITTLLAFLSFILLQLTNYFGQIEGLKAQQNLAQFLYRHILNLKSLTLHKKTVGEMVALYTTDIPSSTMWLEQSIPFALTTAFPLILTPLFLKLFYSIPLYFTFSLLGIIVAANIILARRQSFFFSQFKTLAGHRMGLVNEWIQNIKSLKALNWISSFENKIIRKRIEETNNRVAMVTNGQFMNALSSSVTFWLNLAIISFACFISPELYKQIDLMAVLWVVGIFLTKPLRQLPWFFTMAFDAWTSAKRLGQFFSLKNKDPHIKETLDQKTIEQHLHKSHLVLDIKNLNLTIDETNLLKNINLQIKSGEIVGVIGPVGSGKSLLFKSIMGETPFTADHVFSLPYNYLPQEPFILSAKVKENIIFDYDQSLFKKDQADKSLEQAQFDLKLDRMNEGYETIIGERGLNISGGQKQRLNLSRLFYNPQPLFILDDPFSAVDVGTEHKLIEVIQNLKTEHHSFVVITQRYDFLPFCDRILFIENGQIEFADTYDNLIKIDKYQKFIAGEFQEDVLD